MLESGEAKLDGFVFWFERGRPPKGVCPLHEDVYLPILAVIWSRIWGYKTFRSVVWLH